MQAGISGGRGDGTVWPGIGGELDVSDEEGVQLCAGGLAVPVPVPDPPAETPEDTLAASAETRAAKKKPAGTQG